MKSRWGIAGQAVGVAALVAIVYFAFLDPRDSNQLSGIEVDDGAQIEAPPPRVTHTRRTRRPPNPRRVRAAPSATALTPLPPVGFTPDTPAGSQYQNAVARILGRVAQATP